MSIKVWTIFKLVKYFSSKFFFISLENRILRKRNSSFGWKHSPGIHHLLRNFQNSSSLYSWKTSSLHCSEQFLLGNRKIFWIQSLRKENSTLFSRRKLILERETKPSILDPCFLLHHFHAKVARSVSCPNLDNSKKTV